MRASLEKKIKDLRLGLHHHHLDAPPAPDGFRHRWIRTEVLGFDDTKNMSGKIRSGWELVRADQYPDQDYPSLKRR